jgi:hypothetical protein
MRDLVLVALVIIVAIGMYSIYRNTKTLEKL